MTDTTPLEQGYQGPEPQQVAESLPPGGGKLLLPHFLTFSGIVNGVTRTYRSYFDEALRHSRENSLAIRRDPVIWKALRAVQLPVAQLSWHLECEDDTDSRQSDLLTTLTNIITNIPNRQRLVMHLLEALWFGRYGVQLVPEWTFKNGQRWLTIRRHEPILGDKLVFKFDGTPGVLVHATWDGDKQITDRGMAHFFTPEERESLIIHKHEPEDADFYEPDIAGSIHGKGLRDRIYWFWWLRSQVTQWLMDYLERVGAGGFTIYYYDAGSNPSLTEVTKAAQEQFRNNTILFPRNRENPNGGAGVQRIESSNAGAQLLQTLTTEYFDRIITQTILSTDLESTNSANLSIGGGEADFKSEALSRITKYHAVNLQETLTDQLVRVLVKYSPYPDLEDKIRFRFDVDTPNSSEFLAAARAFYEMGGEIDADELRGVLGLAKPQKGHAILSKVPPMTPTAVGGQPMGVPMLGQPGPQGQAPMPGQGGEGQPSEPILYARERGESTHVTLSQQPINITVQPPEVTVNPPKVTVNTPKVTVNPPKVDVKVAAPPPADVTVNVAAPNVTVNPELHATLEETTKIVSIIREKDGSLTGEVKPE